MKNFILLFSMVISLFSCGNPQSKDDGKVQVIKSAMIVNTLKTWQNNQTLLITFLDGSPERKAEVESAGREWLKYANLNFVFYATPSDIPRGKEADIVITFQATGNNSTVGTDSKSQIKAVKHSMSLSIPSKYIHTSKYYIMHEFGHAIGLEHEHQHIDRNFDLDEVATLNYCMKDNKLSEESCRMHMIQTIPPKGMYFSKYDPKSVMHYGFHEALFKTNKVNIPASQTLSLLDKLEIANVYPGRTTKEKIIADHIATVKEAADTKTYKNCKFTESTSKQLRLNDLGKPELQDIVSYGFDSIAPGEFSIDYSFEDKPTILNIMRANDYCNLDEIALMEYRNNIAIKRSDKKEFGNCNIPLDDNGVVINGTCYPNYPFRVMMNGKDELAVNSCFPNFEMAVEKMKTAQYCNYSANELEEIERKQKEELESTLKFGKCIVKNNMKITNQKEKTKCRESTPWFISDINTNENLSMCYSGFKSAIEDMNTLKKCKL